LLGLTRKKKGNIVTLDLVYMKWNSVLTP